MALRVWHLMLAFLIFMLHMEITSSTREDDFDSLKDNGFENEEELEPGFDDEELEPRSVEEELEPRYEDEELEPRYKDEELEPRSEEKELEPRSEEAELGPRFEDEEQETLSDDEELEPRSENEDKAEEIELRSEDEKLKPRSEAEELEPSTEEEVELEPRSEKELDSRSEEEVLEPRTPHRRYRRRRRAGRPRVRTRRKSRKPYRPRIRKRRPSPRPSRNPCSPSPCQNGGVCRKIRRRRGWFFKKSNTLTFSCRCKHGFYGRKCQKSYLSPCSSQPCLNGGKCRSWGRRWSCKCRPGYRGSRCQDGSSTCYARGDPHYLTFDKKKFDFMGTCEYVLTEDCAGGPTKEFVVFVKNVACGIYRRPRPSCTEAVKVLLAGDKIELTRNSDFVLINSVKIFNFPVVKSDYEITKPTTREIYLTSEKVGLSLSWDCRMSVEVTLTDRHKGKTCKETLCGNNNGNPYDDKPLSKIPQKCKPLPEPPCVPNAATKSEVDKCKLMRSPPFQSCNSVVDPSNLIGDCQYDVCRCENPIDCVCSSFASYSKQCADNGKIVNWRFAGSFLYPPLKACAQKCENSGEIFKECGSACERTCRDLSLDVQCSEECIPGCQCPDGQLLNDEKRCVPIAQCPCQYEGREIKAGDAVEVGKCETCTCRSGVMTCVDDRDCKEKGPCESFPCKNNGKCTENGDSFKCQCVGDFQGGTCDEPKPKPCDSSPCKNNGICSNKGASFSCQCRNNFIGRTCEKKPPNLCVPNPCRNRGVCRVIGNGYSCKCPGLFGGSNCEDRPSSCTAEGDPHYSTFDNRRINFQGKCEYIFAEDCSPAKSFRVWTKNLACGRAASCVSFVRILIDGVEIKLTREVGSAIVNGAKVKKFPIKRKGFVITNPSLRWLHVTTKIGVTVRWDCRNMVTVYVPSKYRGKTCGLCGNNNGNPADDTINAKDYPCVPPVGNCVAANSDAAKIVAKCELMKKPPFSTCNAKVNPNDFIADCKFDACRCKEPMQCVCDSFAAYSQICSRNSIVLDWRFVGNSVVSPPLPQCVQQCKIPGQIFTECGSSCAQSCRDLSRVTKCNEQCVPGCQCPPGSVLSDDGKCISISKCSCEFEGKTLQPGESAEVGNCKTCTCDMGAVKCVEDRSCSNKGPCDSLPCQNDGMCSVKGNSFSCKCPSEYQGAACGERKPTPCDSQPCQNDGVCTDKDGSFTCECSEGFIGTTCADAECVKTKLDILYLVDGSGSVREENFEKVKVELKEINKKFAIGPDEIRIALMQFGRVTQTKIEFNFDEKTSLAAVNQGVDDMKWLDSFKTATGNALKRTREEIFNGKNGDRSDAPNVLILFTDGKATDTAVIDQFEEAKKLKDAGVKVITVAMGGENFIDEYRETLRRLASVDEKTSKVLQFEAGFENLKDLTSKLVQGAC